MVNLIGISYFCLEPKFNMAVRFNNAILFGFVGNIYSGSKIIMA